MSAEVLKEMTTALAREVAELTLLQNDLRSAHAALALWFDKFAARKYQLSVEETLISQSLFRDSLVLFIGCFDKTAPFRLAVSDIYKTPDQAAYFEWLKDVRDSYAAHKFGPFRQCVVGVTINATSGEVITAGRATRIYAGFISAAKDDVLSFIGITAKHVDKLVLEGSLKLIEQAKAMTSAERLALNPAQTYDVEARSVRMTREKFRHSKYPRN